MAFTSGPDLQLITAVMHYREDGKTLKDSTRILNDSPKIHVKTVMSLNFLNKQEKLTKL